MYAFLLFLLTPLQYGQVFVVANWAHGPLPLFLTILYCLAWTLPTCLGGMHWS